ncbi:MAG: chromosome segregation protein SMC [Christensenellales bacterium]
MTLKQLEIYGFKSFADRTVITFDQGITGIIGPNGSGKSNIGDAVRWVMGEQSARSLRGKSMEDVIFGGTDKRKPMAYCEVTLVFDNEAGEYPDMGAEVAVTRRVYRSGESEYMLNRKLCRLRSIVELFRDSGMGRDGYSVIGQGRVDEILSNRPEDRRNVFHEACGIMRFRTRRDESRKRLDTARQNMTRLKDISSVLEGQLEPLAKQSEDARKYLALSQELKELEVSRFVSQYGRLTAEKAQAAQQAEQIAHVLEQRADQAEALEVGLETLRGQVARAEEGLAALREEQLEHTRYIEEAVAEERLARQEETHIAQDIQRLEAEAGEDAIKADALEKEAAELERDAENGSGASGERAERIAGLEERLRTLDAKITETEARVEAAKEETIARLTRLSDLKGERARLTALGESIARQLEAMSGQLAEMEQAREAEAGDITREEETYALITGQRQQIREETDALQKKFEEINTRLNGLTAGLQRRREQTQAARTRLKMLEDMKRDYEGYSNTVRVLLTEAQRDAGLAAHIDHVVAEVLEVPKRYTDALEAALGPALQNVITPAEEDAKALIDYLRTRQLGRATFLPLTAVSGRPLATEYRRVLSMKGCCGVAAELVRYDRRYEGIIQSLLGRTLIAEDMDAAIALARETRHSLRIVTLLGDLIQPGGAMTGGSLRSRNTSILARDGEIEELRALLKRTEDEAVSAGNEEKTLREGLAETALRRAEKDEEAQLLLVAFTRQEGLVKQLRQNALQREKLLEQVRSQKLHLEETAEDVKEKLTAACSDEEQAANAPGEDPAIALQWELGALREDRDEVLNTLSDQKALQAAGEKELSMLTGQAYRLREQAEALRETSGEKREQAAAYRKNASARLRNIQEAVDRQQRFRKVLQKSRETATEDGRGLEMLRQRLTDAEKHRADFQVETVKVEARAQQQDQRMARASDDLEELQTSIWERYELTYAQAQQMADHAYDTVEGQTRIDSLRRRIRGLGTVNVRAVEDYEAVKEQVEEYRRQMEDLEKADQELTGILEDLNDAMTKQFAENFRLISQYFSASFARLFHGGRARLYLSEPENPLESGIEIEAQPPGKKLQLLTLLSGGERALTAIALLFAMLELRPTSFCLLDEIESALDEANIRNFAEYLREYATRTQFVVVTHRKGTMEAADTLYGVTMEEKGISTLLSVRMSDLIDEEVS